MHNRKGDCDMIGCPICNELSPRNLSIKKITDTEIDLAFENVSLEDKYTDALKMCEEMAGALARVSYEYREHVYLSAKKFHENYCLQEPHTELCESMRHSGVLKECAAVLDKHKQWKEGI